MNTTTTNGRANPALLVGLGITPRTDDNNGRHQIKPDEDLGRTELLQEVKRLKTALASVQDDLEVPSDSGHYIEFLAVERKNEDGTDSAVVFTVIHSDTSVEEKIEVPLSNITSNIIAKLNKLVHRTFPKPQREYPLIPSFSCHGHKFALVTPYEALMFLRQNKMQRGLKLTAVDRYGEEHREGRWLLTNQGVGFDINGQDLDGQHRLFTIILEGKPMPLLLVWGLDPAARKVVDCGIGRTVGQVHDMMNGRADDLPAGPVMSQYTTKLYLLHGGTTNKARSYFDSIREFYVNDMEWFYSYTRKHSPMYAHARTSMITTAAIPAAFLMIHHAFPTETKVFAEGVFSRKEPSPAEGVLRDYLNARVEKHENDDYLTITYKILTAFYAFLDGRDLKQLKSLSEKPKNSKDTLTLKSAYRRKMLTESFKRLWDERPLLPKDAIGSIGSIQWDTAVL